MRNNTCSIEGCDRGGKIVRDWCAKHYSRWRRTGSPTSDGQVEDRPERTCSIEGCDCFVSSRGWCSLHYERWRKHGDPLAPEIRIHGDDEARFWSYVDTSGDCWLWTGARDRRGYGRFYFGKGRNGFAHRWAYEHLVGPVPEDKELDHLCRNPPCVNPKHLEPVTHRENVQRADVPGNVVNAAKTHCPQGHPYSGDNLYCPPKGGRMCRACKRDSDRRRRANRGKQ